MKGFTITAAIMLSIWIAAIVGWIMNIVTVIHTMSDPVTGLFIVRCFGIIFAPLGAVLGLFS